MQKAHFVLFECSHIYMQIHFLVVGGTGMVQGWEERKERERKREREIGWISKGLLKTHWHLTFFKGAFTFHQVLLLFVSLCFTKKEFKKNFSKFKNSTFFKIKFFFYFNWIYSSEENFWRKKKVFYPEVPEIVYFCTSNWI